MNLSQNKSISSRCEYFINNIENIVKILEEYSQKKELTKFLEAVQSKSSGTDKTDFDTIINPENQKEITKRDYVKELRKEIDKNYNKTKKCINIIDIIGDMFLDLHYEKAQENPNYNKLHFFARYIL